jgi:hypothetical protein
VLTVVSVVVLDALGVMVADVVLVAVVLAAFVLLIWLWPCGNGVVDDLTPVVALDVSSRFMRRSVEDPVAGPQPRW